LVKSAHPNNHVIQRNANRFSSSFKDLQVTNADAGLFRNVLKMFNQFAPLLPIRLGQQPLQDQQP